MYRLRMAWRRQSKALFREGIVVLSLVTAEKDGVQRIVKSGMVLA